MDEAHEAGRPHVHLLAGRGAPEDLTRQGAGAEVDHPFVLRHVGGADEQRLVVDEQLHQLRVGHVDDRLPRLREPERILRIRDLPRLVEAVQERAVRVRLPSLLGVGPHADVAVAHGEQGLGQAEVGGGELALDEPPRVDREPMLGQTVGGDVLLHTESPPGKVCMRSPTTMSAPWVSKVSGPAPRSMPSTSAKPPGTTGGHARHGVLDHDGATGFDLQFARRLEEHVGCRLPGETETVGDVAVDDDREPLGQASGVEDVGGVAGRGNDRHCDLHLVEEIEHPDRTREGDDALRGQRLAEQRVLAIAERADRGIAGRIARVALWQHDVARLEERTHPIEAGFAVDVGEVVVERERRLGRFGAAGEEVVEHARPCSEVHFRRGRQHAVEVEQHGVVVVPPHEGRFGRTLRIVGHTGCRTYPCRARRAGRRSPHFAGRPPPATNWPPQRRRTGRLRPSDATKAFSGRREADRTRRADERQDVGAMPGGAAVR